MKLFSKILKLIGILIITISVILITAGFLMQNKVGDIVLTSLNKNISTKLSTGTFRLSFLRKFPRASLELINVFVHSSTDFNREAFAGINTDTLISAKFASVEFRIGDILKGIYNIESIGLRDGKISLYSDTTGLVNYDISSKKESSGDDKFTIDLEKINLHDMKASYYNLATRLTIDGVIKSGRLKSRISGNNIDFSAVATILVDSFRLYNTRIHKTIESEINISLESSESGVIFKQGSLDIENYNFSLEGNISSDNILDLKLTGNELDLSKIRNYLPDSIYNLVSDYDPSGILSVNCLIKGPLTRTTNPHIELNCSLNSGHIAYGKTSLAINDLSFTGYFSNGSKNLPESSFISVTNLKANLGSSSYSGSFSILNFSDPLVDINLNGKVFPKEIKDFFALDKISTASGSIDLDLKLRGKLRKKATYSLNDIVSLNPHAIIDFNSFSLGLDRDKFIINQIIGSLNVADKITAKKLEFVYKNQKIKIDGESTNLLQWLSGPGYELYASGNISFDRFIPEAFFPSLSEPESSNSNKTAFLLPGDLFLDINFSIDSLNYKSISASGVSGTLNYRPRIMTFKTLKMESLSGVISGNGFVVQDISKSIIARANVNVSNIDVKKAFKTYNNFGQDFIVAENLAGRLSGSLSFLLPMDSMLNPQIKALTAEGKFTIINGALINFEPVKQLSNFIELSELENISFEKLENDFFIRNNFLYLPQMDVKSSAADLSINGKHSFEDDYEYHIKILLSELLSKKRKKNKSSVSEFGAVEDDGLGRTSMLLKIENKGDVFKVGYDIKAATDAVKTNIKTERQTLKTILNQEYGWFKSDTTAKQKPTENKTRFRITWDENETKEEVPDTASAKKQGLIKNLLKKK